MSGESRESSIEVIADAYIDSTSNRAVGEKAVRQKVIMPVKPVLPLPIIGLPDACIFSTFELAVGDQPMIFFNCIGSTDEHSWSESRKNALCWNGPTLSALSPV
jgi:hypothetical protein